MQIVFYLCTFIIGLAIYKFRDLNYQKFENVHKCKVFKKQLLEQHESITVCNDQIY
jgi:hypothetical protein